MSRVISKDGTAIACEQSGSGPPLILVHGTGGARVRWQPALPRLTRHFTVWTVDRRGRGDSGDSHEYAIEREFEDIAAVVDACPEPAYLLGHSYGALCSLEAALLTRNLAKLALYEPPLPLRGVQVVPPETVRLLLQLEESGDREGLLTAFMTHVVHMPPEELEKFRSSAAWPARVAAAHTLPRELRAHQSYVLDARRLAAVTVPTLVLVGEKSPPFFAASAAALRDALPRVELSVLHGQRHNAMDTAPELFFDTVSQFLIGRALD